MEYFTIGLFALFTLKHIVADYFLQFSWMIRDKGFYGEWGGIAHSGVHGFFTLFVLLLAQTDLYLIMLIFLSLLDSVIHYHIDYVKSNIWRTKNYTSNDQMYWITHGVDQGLHFLTYVLIITIVVWRLI
tara:strand:- start:2068 stop:2454 length:387 start_codon:yes stop_codon:yes gene_type:complete